MSYRTEIDQAKEKLQSLQRANDEKIAAEIYKSKYFRLEGKYDTFVKILKIHNIYNTDCRIIYDTYITEHSINLDQLQKATPITIDEFNEGLRRIIVTSEQYTKNSIKGALEHYEHTLKDKTKKHNRFKKEIENLMEIV